MHAAVALLSVILASVASTAFIRTVYRLDQNKAASPRVLVVTFAWFLAVYAVMAFAIDPDL